MFVGIDIGSITTKAVIIDQRGEILAFSLIPTSYDRRQSGEDVLQLALDKAEGTRDSISYIVATGYGRRSIAFSDKVLPEIVCHAKGTWFLFPGVRTIIDIGGQDSKVIEVNKEGMVTRFEMNDKCAAGTGRFLEVLAERILKIAIEDLGTLSIKCKNPCVLSSVCTVFAESEVISYLSENRAKEDIACGLNKAIAKRVLGIGAAGQISYEEPIVFSGGVARNIGVVRAIEEELGKKVVVPTEPQITAALGAAIFAREQSE